MISDLFSKKEGYFGSAVEKWNCFLAKFLEFSGIAAVSPPHGGIKHLPRETGGGGEDFPYAIAAVIMAIL